MPASRQPVTSRFQNCCIFHKSFPASTQPLHHRDSCQASSWHTWTLGPCGSSGPQRHGVQAHPGGHALAPVIHCSAGLRVSLGGQKAEEAHPDRKAVCQQYTVGGTLANWSSGSLLQLLKSVGRLGSPCHWITLLRPFRGLSKFMSTY